VLIVGTPCRDRQCPLDKRTAARWQWSTPLVVALVNRITISGPLARDNVLNLR
jgi:hypothetical protein